MLQKLVNLMNGVLTVKSKPGEGSIFEFTLPLSVPDAPGEKLSCCAKTTMEERTKLDGMRVALVDSNIVRQVLSFEDENVFLGSNVVVVESFICVGQLLEWVLNLVSTVN